MLDQVLKDVLGGRAQQEGCIGGRGAGRSRKSNPGIGSSTCKRGGKTEHGGSDMGYGWEDRGLSY